MYSIQHPKSPPHIFDCSPVLIDNPLTLPLQISTLINSTNRENSPFHGRN
jgi:hypothetical protein